jgi:CBS domain-containing protein
VIAMRAYVRDIMTTGVVTVGPDTPYREIAAMFREHRVSGFPVTDGDGTDPARLTVTVHNGIVTLEGEPGSAVLGAGIVGQVEHLEGVIAVRDRFVYPARSAPSFPSDPGL